MGGEDGPGGPEAPSEDAVIYAQYEMSGPIGIIVRNHIVCTYMMYRQSRNASADLISISCIVIEMEDNPCNAVPNEPANTNMNKDRTGYSINQRP